jgi:serine/threonine protein kinase
MAAPQVFVSATSRDLGSFRKAVSDVLLTLGAHPVIQENFAPDYRSVVEMLRGKIGPCDVVICLVGHRYGFEPLNRDADQPRRSYTQLEYEIAVELGKPVFVFVAMDDCTLDEAPEESEELRGLQREHLQRIIASDRIRMQFHSLVHLTDQVRVMRFDPELLAQGVTSRLAVLLFAELIDMEDVREKQGDLAWVRDVVQPFHELLQESLTHWGGKLRAETSSEYEVNFETADAAVNAALALQDGLRHHGWEGPAPGLRIGIHVGQIVQFGGVDESHVLQASLAMDECRQLNHLAVAGQTLLTRTAFDIAREHVRQAPTSGEDGAGALDWQSHGRYLISDTEETLEVYEVGVSGLAPFAAPPDSPLARRADSFEQQQIPPWRPAVGNAIPRRPGCVLERKLGKGSFGEVWVARQKRNPVPRVFKFCFDADRLGSFKREQTLFQLLNKALGDRPDISRLHEVNLDEGPFFLESDYVDGGNLREWGEADGRLAALPLDERTRLVAEIAGAVAAAHSVGIIHKDLKPSNILMREGPEGRWHPILADFGIGAVADRSQRKRWGITETGFTRSLLEPSSSRTGTRMYQPPEANLARPATVQCDVYALGVMLYQMVIGDFDQPMGQGFERRMEAARERGFWREPDETGETPSEPLEVRSEDRDVGSDRLQSEGETPSEPRPQPAPAPPSSGVKSLRALDPSSELVVRFLREDVGACVDVDPAARLATAAQLVERLQSVEQRVAAEVARQDAEEAARQQAEEAPRRDEEVRREAEAARDRLERAALRTRRLRAALVTSITALIVVGGLGAFAFTEWRLAETHKNKAVEARKAADQNAKEAQANAEAASQQSQLALDTLKDVIFDIQRGVENLPGSSPIRRRLLGTALARLEKLSGEFVRRSTADRHMATALMDLGDLVLQFGESLRSKDASGGAGPGVGELRGAVEAARQFYTRSMEICQALAKADPNDAQAKRDLSVSYHKLGDVHLRLGATDQALQSYQARLKLSEELAKAEPNDVQAKRGLSVSHNRLGEVHLRLGATDQALQSYQELLKLSEELAKADPNDAQTKRDLTISYNKLGDVHLRLGAADQALQSYQEGLKLSEALAKADPNDAQAKRDLSISHNRLGDAHQQLGATDQALQSYQEGLKLREALAKADPNDAQARSDLSTSYHKLGNAHLKLGATDGALQYFQKDLDLREALAKANPNDAQVKRDLLVTYNELGNVHLKLGATDQALQSYQAGLDLSEALAKADPANVQAQQDLSRSFYNMAKAHERANDLVRARPWYEKMLGVDRELSQRLPQSAAARREVAVDCEILNRFCAQSRDWVAAISYALQALEHARAARQIAGAGQPFQWDFSGAFRYLGDAQAGAGQLKEARQSYEEAVKAGPKSRAAHSALAWFLATCWEDAIRDGKRAVEVATTLCELTEWKDPDDLDTLAAAYAEAGKFDDAVKWEKKVLEKPDVLGPAGLEQAKARLKLYEAHKPYHEPRPEPAPSPKDKPQSR